jgi:aminoglycoside phosphotransferase (APT) family kinase protein
MQGRQLYPWSSDLDLEPTVDEVEQIIGRRFPDLRPVRAEFLGCGWRFIAFSVNEDFVFRFPRRADVVPLMERETSLLSDLGKFLTVPVPRVRYTGEPGPDFPWRFMGQERVPGESALVLQPPPGIRPRLARTLGRLLSRLHSFPVQRAQAVNLSDWSPLSPTDLGERVERDLADAEGVLDAELIQRIRAFSDRELPRYRPFEGEPPLCHQDIGPEHIFFDPGTWAITGVIDWEAAGIGDPAADFAGLSTWLGPEFVRDALDNYERPIDPGFRHRVRCRTVWNALTEARHGYAGRVSIDACLRPPRARGASPRPLHRQSRVDGSPPR